jgi:hypothetical protein
MRIKLFYSLLGIVSIIYAGNQNYAFDASIGMANNDIMYAPIPSMSFYWLKPKGDHELSAEFMTQTKNSSSQQEIYHVVGIGYSFLFELPVKYLFAGPTIGVFSYEYEKHLYAVDGGYWETDSQGNYFFGGKIALIFGKENIRFKIQDRILLGLKSNETPDVSNYGYINNLTASVMFAF